MSEAAKQPASEHDLLVAAARERGWDPDNLTLTQQRWLAIKIKPLVQRVKDAARAVTSVALTTVHLRVVQPEIAARNEAICRNCPSRMFGQLRGGKPYCKTCLCSNKFLQSKWKDRTGHCPLRHWDNRKIAEKDTVVTEVRVPVEGQP